MRVYNAGTTNLTTLYATSALDPGSVLTNPVVAGSDGWTAQIFAAEGTVVDYQTETAGGVVLHTYEDFVFVGASSGAITRDFLTNGRVQLIGRGGNANLEFGDQTGDDTGGVGRIGGWADTQGTSLELDFAAINTTGPITDTGKKLLGVVYTDVTQVTAATSVDIALPNSPTGVRQYRLDLWDYSQSGAGNCNARLSFDGGATYPAVAASYNGYSEAYAGAGATYSTYSGTAAQLFSNRGAANQPARGFVEICTPNSGSDSTHIIAQIAGNDNGTYNRVWSMNFGPTGSGRADHIRLLMSASTFTFKYRLTVLRGSGDA